MKLELTFTTIVTVDTSDLDEVDLLAKERAKDIICGRVHASMTYEGFSLGPDIEDKLKQFDKYTL
jgi:hypothetical protein